MRPGITVAPLVVLLLASLLSGPTLTAAQNGPTPHVLRVNWGDPPPDTLDPQLSHSGQWGISGGVDYEGLTKLDDEQKPVPGAAESIYWGGSPPDTLDPHYSHEGQWDASGGVDFEGLTKLDEKLQPIPGAAESWEFSEDGTTLTFHLREGLVFSDGVPVTAEHFVYAARRLCGPELDSRSATLLFDVVGCEELFTSLDDATGIAAEDETTVAAADTAARRARPGRPHPRVPI